jgi:trehalose/maltose transport system substrate-binding protein
MNAMAPTSARSPGRANPGVAPTRRLSASATTSGILLLALALLSCHHQPEPVTLTFLRPGWRLLNPAGDALSQQFTHETGIQLKNLPVPESPLDIFNLERKLLEDGGSGLDVMGIDVVWAGTLQAHLVDLRPYLAPEISSLAPQLMPSYTVDGKVVAIPYRAWLGALEYRTDLLREYGYDHPPKTWDELEHMAARIQAGERAKGKKDFWGFVWQGAETEALTCNALEWQATEGGGKIIEDDRTISVNNPAAIRSWQRAKKWIGWISPPSVIAYRERDSNDAFDSGRAAFDRVWLGTTISRSAQSRQDHWRATPPPINTGFASLPAGPAGSAATLGGSGLAISVHSAHPQEAVELVRFLIRAELRSLEQPPNASGNRPPQPESYDLSSDLPSGLPSMSDPAKSSEKSTRRSGDIVARPSSVAGPAYEQVTRAYIAAVHSVLTGQSSAPAAAAALEKQLVQITGFSPGPPKPAD